MEFARVCVLSTVSISGFHSGYTMCTAEPPELGSQFICATIDKAVLQIKGRRYRMWVFVLSGHPP